MNHYPHHIGDYDSDTAHLEWLEDMAYTRLMRLYYRTESPLPADVGEVCRLVRAKSKAERAAVQGVLLEFFVQAPDGWHNKRCDAEIAAYRDKAAKAQASANTRWKRGGGNASRVPEPPPEHDDGNANGMRTHSEGNANQNQNQNQNQHGGANPPRGSHTAPSQTGLAAIAMRQNGASSVNPSHPDLIDLVNQGVTPAQLGALVAELTGFHGPKPQAYYLAAMKRRLTEPKRRSIHDDRAETIAKLTGRYRETERVERDITPDPVAVD